MRERGLRPGADKMVSYKYQITKVRTMRSIKKDEIFAATGTKCTKFFFLVQEAHKTRTRARTHAPMHAGPSLRRLFFPCVSCWGTGGIFFPAPHLRRLCRRLVLTKASHRNDTELSRNCHGIVMEFRGKFRLEI